MSNPSFQSRVESELQKDYPSRPHYLEILWRPWRLVALRWARYSLLSFYRTGIHFLRYFLLLSLIPELDLTSLAGWMLKIGLFEATLYGAVEEIREAGRREKVIGGSALRAVRKWNRRMIFLILPISLYFVFQNVIPIQFRGRVFSIYDLIQGLTLMRLAWNLAWMPEFAYVQGKTRMHMGPMWLYLPESLSLLGLPVLIFLLGPWGLAWHFAWEFLVKDGARMRVFFNTRKNLALSHRLLRWPKPSDSAFPPTRVHPIWIGNQILSRAESVLLPVLWKFDIARGLVFYVPLIRSLVDFGKGFQFDVLRNRFYVDRFLSLIVVRRAISLGAVYCVLAIFLFIGTSHLIFGSEVDADELWVFFGAFSFGVLNLILVHRLWAWARSSGKALGIWVRCRWIRCPESTEFKSYLEHHADEFRVSLVQSLGRGGLLLKCPDPKKTKEKIERRAPGLLFTWEELDEPITVPEGFVREWQECFHALKGLAVPEKEARVILDQERRTLRVMIEQGDNGRRSSDRRWRIFYNPLNIGPGSLVVVSKDHWKAFNQRIRLAGMAREMALYFRIKGL